MANIWLLLMHSSCRYVLSMHVCTLKLVILKTLQDERRAKEEERQKELVSEGHVQGTCAWGLRGAEERWDPRQDYKMADWDTVKGLECAWTGLGHKSTKSRERKGRDQTGNGNATRRFDNFISEKEGTSQQTAESRSLRKNGNSS